jgi:hypothetical protein
LVNTRSKVNRSTEVCVRGDKIADSLAGGTLLLRRLSPDIAWTRATISHSGLGRLSQRRWRIFRGQATAVVSRQLLLLFAKGLDDSNGSFKPQTRASHAEKCDCRILIYPIRRCWFTHAAFVRLVHTLAALHLLRSPETIIADNPASHIGGLDCRAMACANCE